MKKLDKMEMEIIRFPRKIKYKKTILKKVMGYMNQKEKKIQEVIKVKEVIKAVLMIQLQQMLPPKTMLINYNAKIGLTKATVKIVTILWIVCVPSLVN